MKQANKWTVKDVITTVLLTVLLIVIQMVVNMVCMVNDFVSMVLSVGFTMLLCAPVYFLMVSRIHKRFVSLIYMTILGCVFLIMGNWYLLPYYIVVGLICEAILWKNGWESKGKMTAAWTISSLLYNGVNLLPIWFFWDTYEAFALSSGMEQSYIDSFVRYYTSAGWLAANHSLHGYLRLPRQYDWRQIDSEALQKGGRTLMRRSHHCRPDEIMGATLCDCWSISDLQRCTDLYLDPARFYIPGVSAKLAASAFFWGVLSPVGSSLVSNSFPRIPYGDLLGILCADALEPVSGFPCGLGSHYHAPR